MATQKMLLKPGVNTQLSQTLGEGGAFASNLIRWKDKLPEKVGGWGHISSQNVVGTVRRLHAWADLTGLDYLAFGSEQRLQVLLGGQTLEITPVVKTTNSATLFSTVNTSTTVTVTDTAHGTTPGTWVNVVIYTAIGGIVLFGLYLVATVIDANNYTITAASPATSTVNLGGAVPLFNTTNTSNVVKVTLANHGFTQNQLFTIQVSTTVATIVLAATQYVINSIVDANNFNITGPSSANATTSGSENGGNARIQYLLASGLASDQPAVGWGSGAYGAGLYGISGAANAAGAFPLRNWSLDNFGQNLVAVPTNGSLYQWVPQSGPAAIVTNAPTVNWGMFVAMDAEQVVLLGASVSGIQDPLLIAWCDAGNITTWAASQTNLAGTFRLARGSKIVGGIQTAHAGLIWTDIELWSMTFIGAPLVYDFQIIGRQCGLIAKNAIAEAGDRIWWMSQKQFFVLDGSGLRPLPCTVWDKIFKNLQSPSKIHAASNANFNEVTWFFASATGNGEIDSYVKYQYLDDVWDYGSLTRTAWIDQSVLGPPIGVDMPNGLLQQHEIAVDADGMPMSGVTVITDFFDIADGGQRIHLKHLIPDFVYSGSTNSTPTVNVSVIAVDYPGDTPTVFGPYAVTPTTQYITIKARARQIALQISSNSFGTQWRLGALRYRGNPAGSM